MYLFLLLSTYLFQSTHPTRGCDYLATEVANSMGISIHAPHEGVRL